MRQSPLEDESNDAGSTKRLARSGLDGSKQNKGPRAVLSDSAGSLIDSRDLGSRRMPDAAGGRVGQGRMSGDRRGLVGRRWGEGRTHGQKAEERPSEGARGPENGHPGARQELRVGRDGQGTQAGAQSLCLKTEQVTAIAVSLACRSHREWRGSEPQDFKILMSPNLLGAQDFALIKCFGPLSSLGPSLSVFGKIQSNSWCEQNPLDCLL